MENYINIPYEVLKVKGLSTEAKIIYCYIQGLQKQGKKVFMSNPHLSELLGKSQSRVKAYISELESQDLLVRYTKNGQRFLKANPIEDRKETVAQIQTTGSDTDHTVAQIQTTGSDTDHTVAQIQTTSGSDTDHPVAQIQSRYNIDNNIKNKIGYSEPMSEVDEDITYDVETYWRKLTNGWKDDYATLTRDQRSKLHSFVKENYSCKNKPTINLVIKESLYIGNAFAKWEKENPFTIPLSVQEELASEAQLGS